MFEGFKRAGITANGIRSFEDAADIERREAAMYGSEWWAENVTRVRSHLAHREFTVVSPVEFD